MKSAPRAAKLWLVPEPQPGPSRPSSAFDDTELLAAVRRGDPSAATAVYDRLRPQVDRVVRRLLGTRDPDRSDMAQLAMLEVIRTIGRYRGESSLDSWTSAVTAHVVYKHIRRRGIERRLFGSVDADALGEAPSPSRASRDVVMRNTLGRVLVHLRAVDEAKASAFILHDVCGYDLREVAMITGISTSAVQTRLVRGRRDLHERIAGDPELANLLESMEGRP